ncbi:DNA ligase [Candidatus Bathyarchaeota archaeon]|nr:MAG: DNA ligase [Candidatus Bathyarchaeota archaeon]
MTLFDQRPIRPMLAKTGKTFDDENYVFEPKWDGLRALLFLRERKLELQNRNLRDATGSYPELQKVKDNIRAKTAVIDGEVVVLGENGTPNFGSLQARFGVDDPKRVSMLANTTPVTYVAFDLLHVNGQDVITRPLVERKRRLKSIIKEGPYLLYGDHVEAEGTRFFEEATDRGFEGVIAKESQSQYSPGLRTDYWIKIKQINTTDCVVIGFSEGEGARVPTFGSLILAAYDDDEKLQHVGNVGGGFSNESLEEVKRKLSKLRREKPTIEGPVDSPTPVTWVKPRIVVEVAYMAVTNDGRLRFPRFKRIRNDKDPMDCRLPL